MWKFIKVVVILGVALPMFVLTAGGIMLVQALHSGRPLSKPMIATAMRTDYRDAAVAHATREGFQQAHAVEYLSDYEDCPERAQCFLVGGVNTTGQYEERLVWAR